MKAKLTTKHAAFYGKYCKLDAKRVLVIKLNLREISLVHLHHSFSFNRHTLCSCFHSQLPQVNDVIDAPVVPPVTVETDGL